MPKTVQEKTDAVIRKKFYVERYANGTSKKILEEILDEELLLILDSKRSEVAKRKAVNRAIKKKVKQSNKILEADLMELYGLDLTFFQNNIDENFNTPKITAEQAIKDGMNRPLVNSDDFASGAKKPPTPASMYKAAFNQVEGSIQSAITGAVFDEDLAKQNIQAAQKRFKRDIESSVRTAAFNTIEAIDNSLYEANQDIVKGIMFSAVLDGRTTHWCIEHDSVIVPFSNTLRAPFHMNCRTENIPVFSMSKEGKQEAREALDYRTQVRAGEQYESDPTTNQKKVRSANVGYKMKKQPDGTYKKVKTKGKKRLKIVDGADGRTTGSASYGDFLQAQYKTPEGKLFIKDTLGKKRGQLFIDEMAAGSDPTKTIQGVLQLKGKNLNAEQLRKRLSN